MDTVEELNGTYFYAGISNLSVGELFFWIFLDTVDAQLGITDVATVASIILGQPSRPTRGKFGRAIRGTSIASETARRYLDIELPFRLPTFTNTSLKTLKPMFVTNLGAFVGRAVPVVGWGILAGDIAAIAFKATVKYNTIARGSDKLW